MQYKLEYRVFCKSKESQHDFGIGNGDERFVAVDDDFARKHVPELIIQKDKGQFPGNYCRPVELLRISENGIRRLCIEKVGIAYRILWGCSDVEGGWHQGKYEFEVFGDQEARTFFAKYLDSQQLLSRNCTLLRIDQEEITTKIM